MSSIIASEVFRNRLLADGRRRIRYKFTIEDNQSQTEDLFIGPLHRPGDWDVSGNLAYYGDHMLESMQDIEDEEACDSELKGNSLTITLNPRWSTSKRIAKKLIRWMMRERDPRIVIWLEPLITYLEANYTNTQLANFLDLTIPQLAKMKVRINAILDDPLTIKSAQTLIAEFDAETENWE